MNKRELEIEMDFAKDMINLTSDDRKRAYYEGYLDAITLIYLRLMNNADNK